VRRVRLAVRDPGTVGGPVDRQVDHLAGRPGRSGQPAQRRAGGGSCAGSAPGAPGPVSRRERYASWRDSARLGTRRCRAGRGPSTWRRAAPAEAGAPGERNALRPAAGRSRWATQGRIRPATGWKGNDHPAEDVQAGR
jgi:hypothetical protein